MTPVGSAGLATAELAVGGMHCDSCALLVEEVLTEQEGVRSASVDLVGGRARVEYDADRLSQDDLTGVIAGAGYSAVPVG